VNQQMPGQMPTPSSALSRLGSRRFGMRANRPWRYSHQNGQNGLFGNTPIFQNPGFPVSLGTPGNGRTSRSIVRLFITMKSFENV